jgi:hypothetical protein
MYKGYIRDVQGIPNGTTRSQYRSNTGAIRYQHACNTGASLKVQGERLGRATCLQERRYCPRRGIRGHLSPLPAGIPLIVARLRRPLVGLRDCPATNKHCNSRSCSQAATVLVDELPREAFGVRPACWRCRKAGVVRKREQAPRTLQNLRRHEALATSLAFWSAAPPCHFLFSHCCVSPSPHSPPSEPESGTGVPHSKCSKCFASFGCRLAPLRLCVKLLP